MLSPKSHTEKRPWGEELWITNEKPSMVKLLTVNPGETLSLQYHNHRDEYWLVLSGDGSAVIDTQTISLNPGDENFIARGIHHRLIGGTTPMKILELCFGDFNQEDIVRLEDKYGRV